MPRHRAKKSRLSRRLRKRLYRILTAYSEFDFRKLRPLGIASCIALLLLALCLLPTSRTDNRNSPEAQYGEFLAGLIREAASGTKDASPEDAIDVVALFFSEEAAAAFALGTSDGASLSDATQKPLYGIYLTGKELYSLAESAVASFSALSGTTVFLSGLSYTYHPLRLPMNRITALAFADGSKVPKENSALYYVITTDELFPLLQSLAHRSQGIMQVSPKDKSGAPLSDDEDARLTMPQSISGADAAYAAACAGTAQDGSLPSPVGEASSSVVTKLGGFNLITLLEAPNLITLYIFLLFLTFTALLCFCIPRIRRVRLWIRIYAIHRRKRGYAIRRKKKTKTYYRKAS